MSRSYRKPIIKDGYGSKWKAVAKRHAARAVRIEDEVANGAAYKRHFNSWDICDYKFELTRYPEWRAKRK
jgi:hypothetical protein